MALDGIFLKHLTKELQEKLVDSRVDKIYQPSKNDIVITFRNRYNSYKLLASCSASNARIHLSTEKFENPKTPPMFCMLLRKKLSRAKLLNITQCDVERAVVLSFDAINELGQSKDVKLIVEIMGKHSNIILVEDDKILDAAKKVDNNISSKRLILPGLKYESPPAQDKLSPLLVNSDKIFTAINNDFSAQDLTKKILENIKGISFIVANTMAQSNDLKEKIEKLCYIAKNTSGKACVLLDSNSKPIEISFINLSTNCKNCKLYESFCEAVEFYYSERDKIERTQNRIQSTSKMIRTNIDRVKKKLSLQSRELEKAKEREIYRIKADVLEANLYKIEKGQKFITLENFYDNMNPIEIKLDTAKSPSQNAQKYYKAYRKTKNSEKFLTYEIDKAHKELEYLESILDLLQRSESENDVLQIKQELQNEGYIKNTSSKKNFDSKTTIKQMNLDGGFKVLIGKNNKQNDEISLKIARKYDLWFHAKDVPGSHVVLLTNKNTPTDDVLIKTAALAAFNSSARNSSKVAVDYTLIKYVKKPKGAKPGKVIYTDYKTLFVKPKISSEDL